jgi:hypothetical protein
MSAYPTPLTPKQIQAGMQLLTANLLGLWSPPNPPPPVGAEIYSAVRIAWQTRGEPFPDITQDVVMLRCVEVDNLYNRVRDVQIIPNPQDQNDPPQTLLQVTTYQRVWKTFWEFYGPNSFDRARIVHSGLFTQAIHDTFAVFNLNLYWVTNPPAPQRIPPFEDGQWWERTDFESEFNEGVTETLVVPIIASVEIKVFTEEQTPQVLQVFATQDTDDLGVPTVGIRVTVPPSAIPLAVGQQYLMNGLTYATWLNGLTLTITGVASLGNNQWQFNANYDGEQYVLADDTGTATLQSVVTIPVNDFVVDLQ